MRVVVAGQKLFGAEVLRVLAEDGHDVAAVFAPPPVDGKPDRIANAAERFGMPVQHGLTAEKIPDGVDLIIAAHSHDFVSTRALLKTRFGGVGYHPSLLPLHRGRDAIRWAIKMGDKVTGGSMYWLSDHVDGGPIAAQDWCFIRPDDDAAELWRRELMPMGLRLLRQTLADLNMGHVVRIEQDEALATWEPSMGRAPLHRPDLLMLPAPGAEPTYRVVRSRH